jgi:ornithine cyclodeaminase
MAPHVYTLKDIYQVTATPEFKKNLLQGIKDGFVAFHQGQFYAAPIQTLGAPPAPPLGLTTDAAYAAQTCVKSGYFLGRDYYVIKVASGGAPWPRNSGSMQVYSQTTGELEALLLDEGILTEWRTAAVGALVVQQWMHGWKLQFASSSPPTTVSCIGMLGTGIQARYQLYMMEQVLECRTVRVWGRTPHHVQQYQQDMEQRGWQVQVVSTPEELNDCPVIVTTTNARTSLLPYRPSRSRRLVVCIGADAPGKQELDPEWFTHADTLISDVVTQSQERGEFQHVPQQECTEIVALGAVLQDTKEERLSETTVSAQLTLFDSSGTAVQDCVVAEMVYQSLRQCHQSS